MNIKPSTYSISEAADKTGISSYTLRYYDKEGLLPFVKRNSGKKRIFTENDLRWLSLIKCLKNTNMSIKDIKKFIDWYLEGDSTLEKRYQFFLKHKSNVQSQIDDLEKYMEKIDYKIRYYKTAMEAGTEAIHKNKTPEKPSNSFFGKD